MVRAWLDEGAAVEETEGVMGGPMMQRCLALDYRVPLSNCSRSVIVVERRRCFWQPRVPGAWQSVARQNFSAPIHGSLLSRNDLLVHRKSSAGRSMGGLSSGTECLELLLRADAMVDALPITQER